MIKTVASKAQGLEGVIEQIEAHHAHLVKVGEFDKRRVARERERVHELVEAMLRIDFWSEKRRGELESRLAKVTSRETTSYDIAHEMVAAFRHTKS